MTQLDKLKEFAMCRITESTQKDSFFRLHRMHRLQWCALLLPMFRGLCLSVSHNHNGWADPDRDAIWHVDSSRHKEPGVRRETKSPVMA